MQSIEERREPPFISGVRVCSVLDISRIILVLTIEREATVKLKGLQGQLTTVHQELWSVNMLWASQIHAKAKVKILLLCKNTSCNRSLQDFLRTVSVPSYLAKGWLLLILLENGFSYSPLTRPKKKMNVDCQNLTHCYMCCKLMLCY